jgi:hypothetical protein
MEAGGLSGKKIKWAGLFFLILFLFFTKSHKRREIPLEFFLITLIQVTKVGHICFDELSLFFDTLHRCSLSNLHFCCF